MHIMCGKCIKTVRKLTCSLYKEAKLLQKVLAGFFLLSV